MWQMVYDVVNQQIMYTGQSDLAVNFGLSELRPKKASASHRFNDALEITDPSANDAFRFSYILIFPHSALAPSPLNPNGGARILAFASSIVDFER